MTIAAAWDVKQQTKYGPRREKTCLPRFATNTGANQPAHPCSLISAFVIRFYKSIKCRLATDEISIFYLVSVAEEYVLKSLCRKPRRKVFSRRGPYNTVIL